ncbi:MAG: hypothetical protein DMG30_13875 [Acidobacteria bacterium]|nr:MAG: hypothetical protein DMG30_13875 [Acidobacteriota bacterium]
MPSLRFNNAREDTSEMSEHHSHVTDQEFRALVRNWTVMLHHALNDSPTPDWRAVNAILNAMEEFSK